MKIKMKQHYYGFRNNYRNFDKGETYEVSDELGRQLIDRGFADEVVPKAPPTKPRVSKTK